MAQPQPEEGWPLGLQPLNLRVGLVRSNNRDASGSVSFNTLLTASPSSSAASSSDLDTESTGSFFPDKSITLGSLIGISSILELSRRSTRGRTKEALNDTKKCRSKAWFFSLCPRLSTDAVSMNTNSSLGHFLEAERRAAGTCRRSHPTSSFYGPDDFSDSAISKPNPLFVGGELAPPQTRPDTNGLLEHGNEYGTPFPLSCLCGQPSH